MQAAKDWYGVVIAPGSLSVDAKKTDALRKRMIKQRLKDGKKIAKSKTPKRSTKTKRLSNGHGSIRALENLEAVAVGKDMVWRCVRCSDELGTASEDYRQFVLRRELPIKSGQPVHLAPRRRDQFRIREYFCPSCGVLMEVDSVAKGEENASMQLK